MPDATINANLNIRVIRDTILVLDYRSGMTSYTRTLTNIKGPAPGAMTVSVAGTDVDFSELTIPSLCRLSNQDATNFFTAGIWDPEGSKFYPMLQIKPGESIVIPLSPDLQEELGTGTGTTGADTNRLRLKADTASVNALVEAFDA